MSADRLCYYCNEGHCALCNGWDRTIVEWKVIEVPCTHGCRQSEQRKPNRRAAHDQDSTNGRNRA
jgi:hypothetical protein